ncbi:MAG: fumarylacetoacetate hydrolase family protein [Alphaproteobacteria bacterium]|nr:fumarylacetoacetate hydrolase family protein [Alphaproteobacteria bacterium]
MKYASFIYQNQNYVGLVFPERNIIYPIKTDMISLIKAGNIFIDTKNATPFDLDKVTLLAPIPNPIRNIFCIGKNYKDHILEVKQTNTNPTDSIPQYPIVFTKATNCVIGTNTQITLPKDLSTEIDYEAELAVIIGKKGRFIKAEHALDYIFGYTIANDLTARDIQVRHKQWFLGKSIDHFLPLGPWITTKDEVDGQNLTISCWVNDELRQHSNTSEMIFNIAHLIETISTYVTLEAGDIIATGTPAGVGMGHNPPIFLKSGDRIKITIEKLGGLENVMQ